MFENKRSRFVTTLFIGLQLFANARSVRAENIDGHSKLWDALNAVGVRVVLNHPEDCKGHFSGMYDSYRGYINICQDNATEPFTVVEWTANDFDTLRHEAQHVIQDCNEGKLADGLLSPMFADSKERNMFVESSLPDSVIKKITLDYARAPLGVLDNELEAWAVARVIDPGQIAYKVIEYCRL